MAGIYVDYEKLMRLGVPGLKAEVHALAERAHSDDRDGQLYVAMQDALDLFVDVCYFYRDQIADLAQHHADPARQQELRQTVATLEAIAVAPPQSLRQAIQLAWLYSIVCGALEYGRMDVYLGDFYVRDIENGAITEAEELGMVQSIWQLINDLIVEVDGRVIIGGRGRPNEANADRFALLAMEATRTTRGALPQLTLRFYEGMNPALMEKAYELLVEGTTYPLLYNDDILIDAVMAAQDVPRAEAEQYVPLGCGEIVLDHRSFGTPSGAINLLKLLEVTLHNGIDPVTGQVVGLQTGEFASFASFEALFAAYQQQATYFIEALADHEALEYQITGESTPFLYLSMLYDDCLERGKGLFAGGIRYLGGTLETYGNVNTADSLTAIKELVFDRRVITPERLLEALNANFDGFETERRWMLDCPKFGNDDANADNMLLLVHNFVCSVTRDQRDRIPLHSYLVVIINNSMNTTLGRWVGASADGRKAGGAMANANTPAGGNDQKGVTALINSIVKPSHAIHGGAVHNLRFSREFMTTQRSKFDALQQAYFKIGGAQVMITVINRGDLEKAMQEPEKYQDVFVRVGGFSARFVDLPNDVQMEILSRKTY